MSLFPQRVMSERERRTRNRANAYLATSSAGLGLAAAGTRGGAYAVNRAVNQAAKGGKIAGKVAPRGRLENVNAKGLERASTTLTTAGVGVGSVWSLNGAKLSYDASKRRPNPVTNKPKRQVSKSMIDFGLDGVEQGDSDRYLEQFDVVSKSAGALVPVSKAFDSERSRLNRTEKRGRATERAQKYAPMAGTLAAGGLAARGYMHARDAANFKKLSATKAGMPKGISIRPNPAGMGRAAGFGLAAIGTKVAADRFSSYKPHAKRAGNDSYRPLYRPNK